MAKAVMFQGTSSSVGKSTIAASFCRIFREDGFKVAPFKAQNMSSRTFMTCSGEEISISQAMQARAAGVSPTSDMNPVLLKPQGHMMSNVIIHGKPIGNLPSSEYRDKYLPQMKEAIYDSYRRLSREYDVIVIEGAGSPVEVNLKDRDIVNMSMAKIARAPVILVADISLGGVFASIIGTLELLEPDEKDMVAGIVINKFMGDITLFEPGVDFLEERTGKPVFGVVPYVGAQLNEESDGRSEEGTGKGNEPRKEVDFDQLAHVVRHSIDMSAFYSAVGIKH